MSDTVTKEAGCDVSRQSAVTTEAEYKHFRYSETNTAATTSQAAGADTGSTCGGYKDVSFDSLENYTVTCLFILGFDDVTVNPCYIMSGRSYCFLGNNQY